MFEKIIRKYNLNLYGMIRNGTVAVITMFGVWILFGVKNIMIAFPIALTSTVLGRKNFYVKPFNKITKILILDLLIVTLAFISSINIWSGIIINLISIFSIMYLVISPYDLKFYKPFIMLYIFTQYSTVSISELPERLLSVVFGVVIIFLGSYIKKVNEKNTLGNTTKSSLKLIDLQIENILNENFDEELKKKCSKAMNSLAYRIYVTRHKNYLTTNLGKHQFEIYIYVEYLNLYLREIYKGFKNNEIKKDDIKTLKAMIELIIKYCDNEENIDKLVDKIRLFVYENEKKSKYLYEISQILLGLSNNICDLEKIDDKEINEVYKEWERGTLDRNNMLLKEYFHKDSIRFKFAVRMSITLSLALLVSEFLGFYKIIWAVINIMSIMQPYYEDTIRNVRDRIIGNTIAILFTGIIINLINSKIVTIGILLCALYLLYGFKEYSKISLFAGIASICVSSLSENINTLIFYRIGYVIVGVVIVLIANKFILPYKLENGINDLIKRIERYTKYLISNSEEYLNGNKESHEVRDLVIHTILLDERLKIKNKEYKNPKINEFISDNNEFVVFIGYKVLMANEKYEHDYIKKCIESGYETYKRIYNNTKKV